MGDEVSTTAGERRRAVLPDGSILYLNQNSRVKLTAPRQINLIAGEVFVEVVPQRAEEQFTVKTPTGEVAGSQSQFAVRREAAGTGVVVTRSRVKVSGIHDPVVAGQELVPGAIKAVTGSRASHALGWVRDLMAGAESALVPASKYAGGALVALDPNGQEAKLSLRKFHIDVHIEDGFARTTIDQTYFNHEPTRLEGTFYFPLPADASLSRLAMYVDGQRMEGGMVERDYARQVYESILYRQRDPALLEWVDGTTFKMRVFPLEPRQEKRIVLSYSQRLPSLYGQEQYRFPAGHTLESVRDWSFHARINNGAPFHWSSPSHTLKATEEGADLLLDAAEKNVKPDRDVVVFLSDREGGAEPGQKQGIARFSSAEHEGAKYLMVRYRPNLPGGLDRQRRDWVVLFESSGDRDPLLARAQVEIIRSLLAQAEPEDNFAVLTAGTRVRGFGDAGGINSPAGQEFFPSPGLKAWAREKLMPVTPQNVESAVGFLESAHLIGALDLGNALAEAAPVLKAAKNPWLVHVGSGIAAMGERREQELIQRIPQGARYVGIGVGKRWARNFMKAAAEQTGGYFTQINPDEPISWRTFDLVATLNTPRLLNVTVTADPPECQFLTDTGSVAQGEEFWAVARLGPETKNLPETLRITGVVDGKPFAESLRVQNVAEHADYLPRTWTKLEIDRLLSEFSREPQASAAEGAKDRLKSKIIDLSKSMYVMTPFTSLLVLENEDMYVQYKVDRGRKDHWAMYGCPAKMPIVYEPLPGMPADLGEAAKGRKPTVEQLVQTIHIRNPLNFFDKPQESAEEVFRRSSTSQEAVRAYYRDMAMKVRGRTYPVADLVIPIETSVSPPATLAQVEQLRINASFARAVPPFGGYPGATPMSMPAGRRFDNWSMGLRLDEQPRRPEGGRVGRIYIAGNTVRGHPSSPMQNFDLFSLAGKERATMGLEAKIAPATLFSPRDSRTGSLLFGVGDFDSAGGGGTPDIQGQVQETSGQSQLSLQDLGTLLYDRPSFKGDDRFFYDLVAYAPGMNTSWADIQSVLETEGEVDPHALPGRIDTEARKLIDQARAAGWQTYTFPKPGLGKSDNFAVTFDSRGRFAYERTLPPGIRERVVCDGRTLLHLYPDIGIGARRTVSRFHRLELAAMIPWVLPPAEDLAHGADLKLVDERTVAIVPHESKVQSSESKVQPKAKTIEVHLVFGNDGRLAERRIMEMPGKKTLYRQICQTDGVVKLLDAEGKELAVQKGMLASDKAPDLRPDTENLVVLPLPYRSREQVKKALKIENKRNEDLRFDDALVLFAAELAAQNSEALKVFRESFHGRDQRQLGFYVLLAAAGQNLDAEHADVLSDHPNEPLAQYLALYSSPVLRKHASQWAVVTGQWPRGFLHDLAVTHALYQHWQSNKAAKNPQADRERALDYIRNTPLCISPQRRGEIQRGAVFGWGLLCLLQDRAGKDEKFHAALAEAFSWFEEVPGLAYAARYEHARSLWKAGRNDEARKRFQELYEKTLEQDQLPPIDADFRQALAADGEAPWSSLVRKTAGRLIKHKRRPAVLALAWQCWQLDDQPLANEMLTRAIEDIAEDKERLPMRVAGLAFFMETGQWAEGDQLLEKLLADHPETAKWRDGETAAEMRGFADSPSRRFALSGLWRLGGQIAEHRDMKARELECLEQALEAEYQEQPEVVNLKAVREDYEKLLDAYQQLAVAMVTLKIQPPADFRAKVIRTADRWRALDSDATTACESAARILQTLGDRDLVWDYLTTPVALHPAEAEPWRDLAQTLSRKGDLELADRAYQAAFEAEPTNAQILWDRARNLRQAGKTIEAQKIYRQLADGKWSPQFQWVQAQARRQVEGK
jgi:tetratricopeptide (TPR) repeat protein